MKKLPALLTAALILAGCTGLPNLASLIASPTPPPPPDTFTPRPTVTLIPTIDLFAVPTSTPVTFTPTAGTPLPDPPTPTLIPLPTFSEEFILDQSNTTFFNQTVGFQGIIYSSAVLYWGEGPCVNRSIKMTAFVDDPARTDRVFLFLRLRDKKNTLNVGEWSAGAEMIKLENGSFNYIIETHNLRRYFAYKNAWIEYELVSVNENLEILGRTQLYDKNLSLMKCGFTG
jgi:hypothetical protein